MPAGCVAGIGAKRMPKPERSHTPDGYSPATSMVIRPSTLLALAALCGVGLSASKEEWRSRTLYQVVTDRFARGDGSTTQCSDLSDYCGASTQRNLPNTDHLDGASAPEPAWSGLTRTRAGGTWNGIAKRLDYIQNMGFDAIWISPIPVNAPKGYHGYWATRCALRAATPFAAELTARPRRRWNELNSHFGGEADLKNLVRCAARRRPRGRLWLRPASGSLLTAAGDPGGRVPQAGDVGDAGRGRQPHRDQHRQHRQLFALQHLGQFPRLLGLPVQLPNPGLWQPAAGGALPPCGSSRPQPVGPIRPQHHQELGCRGAMPRPDTACRPS